MFATRLSTLLPRFFSWKPESQVEATDAFLQDWSAIHGYAHPPWCLIQRCLKKATFVMVTPLWTTLSWFRLSLHRLSTADSSNSGSAATHCQCRCPISKSSCRLAYLRESLRSRGVSADAEELILSAWRGSTNNSKVGELVQ